MTPRPLVETLPPLRILMGGAMGIALAPHGGIAPAAAQTAAGAAAGTIQLPTVDVGGEAGTGGYQTNVLQALPRFTQPVNDTPQSVSVISPQLFRDQSITATRDALRNVPGISLAAGEAGAQGDNLTLRGFSARSDFFRDGMRDFGSYGRDPFDDEEIAVLKGPSSIAFGRGSTGGVINQVSKQPGLAPITAGTLSFGTDGTKRMTADVNRAVGGLTGTAVRLNLMVNQNGVADRNGAEYNRFGVAPSVTFGLGTDTRLSLTYFHLQEYDTPDYGLPWFYGAPASVPRQNYYGFQNSDYLRTNVNVGTVKLEHDVNQNLQVRNQLRYGTYSRSIRVTEPQVATSGSGARLTPTVRTPLGSITVNRQMIPVGGTETLLWNQTDGTARFDTGPLGHTLVAGMEGGQETSAFARTAYTGFASTTNLLNPSMSDLFAPKTRTISSDVKSTLNSFGLYAIDTIRFLERFDLTAGVRWDYAEADYRARVGTPVHLFRTDSMASWRVALAYHPVPEGTLYAAYGTSFNPSAEGLTLATGTAGLAPEENESYELGAKWEVLSRKLTLTGALFQIEKTNARVADPDNTAFSILGGDQRVRGFELGAVGNVSERWQIQAGYAYLDSEVVKTTLANTQGNALANTPKHSGSLFTTYKLPWHGIEVGGGANFVSSRLASSSPDNSTAVLKKAAGYMTVQAMARMPLPREGFSLQLNGYNLTGQKYYDLLHPSHVVPGAGRTLLLSLNVKL